MLQRDVVADRRNNEFELRSLSIDSSISIASRFICWLDTDGSESLFVSDITMPAIEALNLLHV